MKKIEEVTKIPAIKEEDPSMPILARSKLWGKGHTTVLNKVRKLLDLSNGDSVERIYEDDKIIIKKAPTSSR